MITITSAVKEIIEMDEIARNALQQGLLNYSNYARKIHAKVAARAKKPVKLRSIIVSLTRLDLTKEYNEILIPKITTLSVHAPLQELTYPRSLVDIETIQNIYKSKDISKSSYFVISQSTGEVTIVADENIISELKSEIKLAPTYVTDGLVGVTIRFPIEYMQTPNVIYEFMKKLAAKKINIIEVVSTTTELTFIIQSKDLELTVNQLSRSF